MKYNTKTSVKNRIQSDLAARPDATANEEGGLAFDANDKTRLVLQTLTCLVNEPKFYGGKKKQTNDVIKLAEAVAKEDPQFVINLAKVARHEFYLRSVPVVLMAALAKTVKGRQGMAKEFSEIIGRADELAESIAAYQAIYGKRPLPSVLKRGVAGAFKKFDEYQFAKYNRDRDLSLKDSLRIVIGFLNEKDQDRRDLYQKILEDNLAVPNTWEVTLSTKGASKETWESIIPKMGYFALIRNLRNFEKHKVDLDPVIKKLVDKKLVLRSRLFPYRFYAASKHVTSGRLKTALSTAIEYSIENVPKLPGKTLVAIDSSGSMNAPVSKMSEIQCYELANLLGAMSMSFCEDPMIVLFDHRLRGVELNGKDSILTNHTELNKLFGGGSTYAHLIPEYLIKEKIKVDRVILLSDMQCYSNRNDSFFGGSSISAGWKQYTKMINTEAVLYSIDLAGYGTLQFPASTKNVVKIAGWSDKIFNFIGRYEAGPDQLIKYIEGYNKHDRSD